MTPLEALRDLILPALEIADPVLNTKNRPEAAVLLLAIMIQESALRYRKQLDDGPARGLFQMEPGERAMLELVMKRNVALRSLLPTENPQIMWTMLEDPVNDKYSVYIARAALKTDSNPLPKLGDSEAAWNCYIKNWRPGKPRPEKWGTSYEAALGAWRSLNQREKITDSRTIQTATIGGLAVTAGQTVSYLAGMPLGFWIFLAATVGVLGAIVYFRWEDFRDKLT